MSRVKVRLIGATVAAVLLAGCGGGTDDPSEGTADGSRQTCDDSVESMNLSMAFLLSEKDIKAGAALRFMEIVKENSGGRIEITPHFSGSYLPATEIFSGVADGRVDLGQSTSTLSPAELPLSQIEAVPFLANHPPAQLAAFHELYDSNDAFRAEWAAMGLHMLAVAPTEEMVIGTTEPLDSIDDLANQRIRVLGGLTADVLTAVGATPMTLPPQELYESVSRGLVDGWGSVPSASIEYSLGEVTPHITDVGVGSTSTTQIVIGLDRWEGFSEPTQRCFIEARAQYEDEFADYYSGRFPEICEAISDQGVSFAAWDESEVDRLKQAAGPAVLEARSWFDAQKVDESTAQEFLNEYKNSVDEHADEIEWKTLTATCMGTGGTQ